MEFRILGSQVDVRDGNEPVSVSPSRVRRLLVLLLVEEGRLVSEDVVRERVGDVRAVESVVSGVRGVVGDRLVGEGRGYRLRLGEDDYLDLREFRELVARARRLRGSDAGAAAAAYRRALELWGERPLHELDGVEVIRRSLLSERREVREELGGVRRSGLMPLGVEQANELRIDTGKASPARIYDYYLGGKDNYAVDREAAEEIMRTVPEAPAAACANRAFLGRAVRYLVAEVGIRQFVDVGAGLPTQGNVHEIAHETAPDARVVYVDNDPVVLIHGRALLEGNPNVAVIQGELRRPEEILADARLNELIDFGEPVGLLLVAILHFIPDEDDPAGLVARLARRLPPGSHVVISHLHEGGMDPDAVEHAVGVRRRTGAPICLRGPERLAHFLAGLDVLDPGIVWVPEWGRPDAPDPQRSHCIGAVARKP